MNHDYGKSVKPMLRIEIDNIYYNIYNKYRNNIIYNYSV